MSRPRIQAFKPSRRVVTRVLLAMNLLWCTASLAEPRLPGWKMFVHAERFDYRLTDNHGRALSIPDYLPRGAYIVQYGTLAAVVSWICRAEPARAPFRFEERVRGVDVRLPPDCRVPQ